MVNLTLVNENAFGGKVMSGPVSELENYLGSEELKFSGTGVRSFLKVAKTPASYYNKQPESLQRDLLTSMKSELKFGNILFLIQEGKVVFAAPENEIEQVDPIEKFDMLSSDWKLRRQDLLYSGVSRYHYLPNSSELVVDEYLPTMYIDVPVLYAKNIKFEVGLYKVLCSNGMLDKVSSKDFSLNPKSFSNDFFTPIVQGVLNGLENNTSGYLEFLNYIKNCPLSLQDAKMLTLEMTAHRVIYAGLSLSVLKYFDLTMNGKTVSNKLPATIASYYDLMDVLTYYAQKAPSVGVQSNVESSVFQFFYTKYQTETKVSLAGINIKNFVPGEQTEIIIPKTARKIKANKAPVAVLEAPAEVQTEVTTEVIKNETLAQATSFLETHDAEDSDEVVAVDTPKTKARKKMEVVKAETPNIDDLI